MRDRAPVRVELERSDDEDEQREAAVAEDPLDPLERHQPEDEPEREDGEDEQRPVGEAREKLERDRDAADLRRERQQVDELAGDERDQTDPEAEPLADRVEDRGLGHRGDAPAHLGVGDDPAHPEHDRPEELVAEGRAGGDVEDDVADVDEAADRGQDAERDAEDVLHPASSSAAFAWLVKTLSSNAAKSRSPGRSASSPRSSLTFAASCTRSGFSNRRPKLVERALAMPSRARS